MIESLEEDFQAVIWCFVSTYLYHGFHAFSQLAIRWQLSHLRHRQAQTLDRRTALLFDIIIHPTNAPPTWLKQPVGAEKALALAVAGLQQQKDRRHHCHRW